MSGGEEQKILRTMMQQALARARAGMRSQSSQASNKPGLFKQYEIANAARTLIDLCSAEPALKNGRALALAEASLAALERELGILGVPSHERK